MNIWQGKFPKENKGKDGHIGVAPVKAFQAQNSFGEQSLDTYHVNVLTF